MKCKNFQETYILFLYGELEEKEELLYEEHLQTCQECKEMFEQARETRQIYEQMEEEEPAAHIVDKIKEYSIKYPVQKKKINWLDKISIVFTFPRIKLAMAGLIIIIAITILPFFYKKPNTSNYIDQQKLSLYGEDKVDKAIKSITYNTRSFSDSKKSFGIEKKGGIMDAPYMDQKMSDIETEVNSLKVDFAEF